jgi:hypothetical protein
MTSPGSDLHAFVIRARREPREIAGAPSEWRFWVEHHPGGERHYYGDFAEVLAFIMTHLPPPAIGTGAPPSPPK